MRAKKKLWIFASIVHSMLHYISIDFIFRQLFVVFDPIWCSLQSDSVSKSFELYYNMRIVDIRFTSTLFVRWALNSFCFIFQ